jgi:hypothetical protein
MSESSIRQWSTFLNDLRHLAAHETGERRRAADRIIAKLEQQQPQRYASEAHAALACWRCGKLPCVCGTPKAPTFDDILKVQQQRRGLR